LAKACGRCLFVVDPGAVARCGRARGIKGFARLPLPAGNATSPAKQLGSAALGLVVTFRKGEEQHAKVTPVN